MATTTPYAASLAASASFSKSLPMAVGYRVMGRRRRRRKMMMTMLHGQIAFQPAVVAATAAVMVGRGGGRGERSRQIVVSSISPFSVRQSQPQHQQQAAWYSTMRGDEQQQRTRRNNQHQHQQHKRLTTRHREEMGEFFKEAVATLKLIQEEYGGVGMGGNEENQAFHRLITGAARFYEPDRALIWLEKMQEAGYTVSRGQHNIVINAFAKKAIYISTQPNVTQSKNTCSRLADKAKMLMEQKHHTDHQDQDDDLTPFRETLCNVVLGLLAAKKHQTVLAILAKDGNGKYSNDKTSLLKGGNAHFYAKAAREIGKQRKALFIERSKSFSQMLLIKQQERRKAQKQHKQQQEQGHDYTKEEGKLNNNGQSQQQPHRKSKADKYSDTLSQLGNILVSRMLEEIDEEEEEALSGGGGEHNIKQEVYTNALFAVMGGQDHKICKSLIDKICQQGLGPNAIRGIFSAYEMADKCQEAFSFLAQLEDENIKIPPMCYESVIRCAGFLGELDICVQASHRFIASGYELGGKQIISTLRACALTGEPTLSSHLLSELSLEYHNGEPLQTPLPYAMHIIACFQAGAIQEGLECLETASEANNVHFQVQHLLDMLTALKPVGSEEKEKRKKEATITSIIEKIMTKSKVRVNSSSSSSSSSIRNTRSMDNKQDNTSSSCINQAEIVKMAASVLVAYDELHAAKRMMLNQSKELPYSSSSSPSSSSIQEKDVIRELKSAIKGVISAEVLEEKVAAVFDAFGITSTNSSSNSTKGSVKMSTSLLTSLLNTYLAEKHYKAVEAKFLDFERYGLRPDAYAFSVLMGVARGEKNYHKRAQKANQVLTLMEESKYTTTTTAAADDHRSHRSTQDLDYVPYVQALKFSIPQKDDFLHLEQDKKHINNSGSVPSSSSSSLRYYYPDLSPLCILERMEKHGLTPNEEVIINAIKACRYLPTDHEEEEEEGSPPIIIDQNSVAEAILVKMESYGIPATYPILHALLELYAGGTTKRNISSTNRAATGGGGGEGPIGQQEKAEEIFRLMSQQDSASSGNSSSSSLSCIRPIDFHLVAKAGRETGDVKHVEKWAELLQDHGFSIDRQFYLTILNTFSNSKDPEGMAAWLQRAKSDGMLTAKEFARYFNIVAVKMALHDKNLEGFYEVATAIVDLKSDNLKSSSANIMLEATQHVKGDKEAIHFFKKVYFIADPKNTVVGRVATVNRKTVEYLIKSFGRDHTKVLLQETNNCPNQWQDMLS